MRTRLVWGALTASAVMMVSGVAISGNPPPTPATAIQIQDFNQASGELWAIQTANQAFTAYLHSPQTRHLLADLSRFAPPDPCRPLATAWNYTIQYDNRYGVRSTFVFDILLTLMGDFQCRAGVTTTGTTTPTPLVVIQPTASQ